MSFYLSFIYSLLYALFFAYPLPLLYIDYHYISRALGHT
jgi:hypothetical protein